MFSSRPRDDVRALFGRSDEIRRLRSVIQNNDPLVVITGLRRTGKTSLLCSVLAEHQESVVRLDMRSLERKRQATKAEIAGLLAAGVSVFLRRNASRRDKILDTLRTVRGIRIAGTGIDLGRQEKKKLDMAGLFRHLDLWAEDNGTNIVVSIDEAQELGKARHLNINGMLASVYDNCKNTMLVLTGSEIGLLHKFLALDDPRSPLFGRHVQFIDLKPLSARQSSEFLRAGFEELGTSLDKSAEDAIQSAALELGGVMGWLNRFGLECVKTGTVGAAELRSVRAAGSKLAKDEFERFLSTRTASGRYESIMKGLWPEGSNWRALRNFVHADLGKKIHDKNFCDLLAVLLDAGFVVKEDGVYSITDPLLHRAYRLPGKRARRS